jgi:hypothetical protein
MPTGADRAVTLDIAVPTHPPTPIQRRAGPSPDLIRSLARVGARSRLEGELRLIAIDVLGLSEPDELPPGCSGWVYRTADAAVSGVCEASLAALVHALDALLAEAPLEVARRLDEARARHDAGWV